MKKNLYLCPSSSFCTSLHRATKNIADGQTNIKSHRQREEMKTMNSVMPALLKAWREKPTSSQQRFYINNTKIIYSPRYFPCSMLNVSILLYWITPPNNPLVPEHRVLGFYFLYLLFSFYIYMQLFYYSREVYYSTAPQLVY